MAITGTAAAYRELSAHLLLSKHVEGLHSRHSRLDVEARWEPDRNRSAVGSSIVMLGLHVKYFGR